jgi:hypothetical protein
MNVGWLLLRSLMMMASRRRRRRRLDLLYLASVYLVVPLLMSAA